jgi:hypothetical protein
MSNPLYAGESIAQASLVSLIASAAAFPAAWPLVSESYKLQADPGAIWDAGQNWIRSAEKLEAAIDTAINITQDMGRHWEGADYDAFRTKMQDYIAQMMAAQIFAYTVAVALCAAAVELFFAISLVAMFAVSLNVFLVMYLAAVSSLFGNAGASELIFADAQLWATSCDKAVKGTTAVMKVTDLALTSSITTLLTGNIAIQVATGDHHAIGNLVKATVDGLDTILTGLGGLFVRDKGADAIASPTPMAGPSRIFTDKLAGLAPVATSITGTSWEKVTGLLDSTR